MELLAHRSYLFDKDSKQVIDRRFLSRPDVIDSLTLLPHHGEVCLHHIIHKYEISRLPTIAVYDRLFTIEQFLNEDGHDSSFAIRILARAVDVGIAEIHHLDPADTLVIGEILFTTKLTQPIGREGLRHMSF